MGTLAVIVCAVALVGLVIARIKLANLARDFERDEPERPLLIWGSRTCLLVFFIALVVIVDSYVYKLPNPFAGPTVGDEMPKTSPPPPKPDKPDIEADDLRPDMKDVRDEHRERLKDFENE